MAKEVSTDGGKTWHLLDEPPPAMYRDAATKQPTLGPGDPGPIGTEPQTRIPAAKPQPVVVRPRSGLLDGPSNLGCLLVLVILAGVLLLNATH